MIGTIRRAFALMGSGRRRKFAVVALLALAVSGLEAAAALLVLLLLRLLLNPGEVPELPVVGDLRGFFPEASYEQLIIGFAVLFAIFFLVRAIAFLAQQYAVSRVAENTGVLLAHRLLDGYLSMPYDFHLRRNSAELIRNAYDNVQELVRSIYEPVAILVAETALILVMLVILIIVSPTATLLVAAILGVTVLVTFAVVQPSLKRFGAQRQSAASAAMRHLQQGLGALRDIKVLGRERLFSSSFRRARSEMAHAQYWRAALAYTPRVSIETAFLVFVLLLLVLAVVQDSMEGVLSTLGLFAYAGLRIQPSLQKVANALNNVRFAQAAVDDLSSDMELLDVSLAERDEIDQDPTPLPFQDAIQFEDVAFRYQTDGEPALERIDLTISRGESIGVAGHTGGGKTTLLDLLCGLLLPSEGRITVDGIDIANSVRAWQRNIGVVHQTSFLLDDTVRRNVAFGVPDDEINMTSVRRALAAAEVDDFVDRLSDGLDTLVGERGVRLSGGQRQRITLARALYREPKLLVLDEGTSALDNATEARVIANLAGLSGQLTLVMVAHRLSTIMRCDRIVFVEDGRISGIGTFEELKRDNPTFRALAV